MMSLTDMTSVVTDARVKMSSVCEENGNVYYHCNWCGDWNESTKPEIATCLTCEGLGPHGHECAYCWTKMKVEGQEEKPKTVIDQLKYYLDYRLTGHRTVHDKFSWYVYTMYIMELAREEILWEKTIAEKDKDGEPIIHGICVTPNVSEDGRIIPTSSVTNCEIQQAGKFPLQTGRTCKDCYAQLTIASYNKDLMEMIQCELTDDPVGRYVSQEQHNVWTQAVKWDEIENYEDKWSHLYGIRKVRWRHPLGAVRARRMGGEAGGWRSVLKARFRQEKYSIKDFDLQYLEPFENGTLQEGDHPIDTEINATLLIDGPRLGFTIYDDAHLHESAKDATEAQLLIDDTTGELMRYCHRLQPYLPMSLESQRKLSTSFTTFTPQHPGYLTYKKYGRLPNRKHKVESAEEEVKKPDTKKGPPKPNSFGMADSEDGNKKRRIDLIAVTTTTGPFKYTGHTHEHWIFDTGATTHVTNNDRYMFNIRASERTITVADGTQYPVQSEGELAIKSICGAVLTLKAVCFVT